MLLIAHLSWCATNNCISCPCVHIFSTIFFIIPRNGIGEEIFHDTEFDTNIVYITASVVMVRVMSDLWWYDLMNIF